MQKNPSSDANGRYHDEGSPGISYSPNFQGMFTIYNHIQQLSHIQSQTDQKKILQSNLLTVLGYSPVFHKGPPKSTPGKSMWDLCRTNWY